MIQTVRGSPGRDETTLYATFPLLSTPSRRPFDAYSDVSAPVPKRCRNTAIRVRSERVAKRRYTRRFLYFRRPLGVRSTRIAAFRRRCRNTAIRVRSERVANRRETPLYAMVPLLLTPSRRPFDAYSVVSSRPGDPSTVWILFGARCRMKWNPAELR